MCGRLNVTDAPLTTMVSQALGIKFEAKNNNDLRPTQEVSTIVDDAGFRQLNACWGIKPSWANKLLINAQAETVATKPTFRKAFNDHRCVVPCSGWYEWSALDGSKKKYLFENPDGQPLYMAGIYYPREEGLPELVTLTTAPVDQCKPYHHRMPLLISERSIRDWLSLPVPDIAPLLIAANDKLKVNLAA